MAGYTPKREGYDLMKKSFLSLFGGQQGQPTNRRRLLAVLGLAVCICMSPAPADESVYMLIDSESIHTVTADSGLDYDSSALYAAPHSAGAADVQLILNKGQQVQVSNAVQGCPPPLSAAATVCSCWPPLWTARRIPPRRRPP